MQQSPRAYLRQIWFDTVVYEPQILQHLINVVGASQIVIGTDYPYDMGQYDVHGFIASLTDLTNDERRAILGAMLRNYWAPSDTISAGYQGSLARVASSFIGNHRRLAHFPVPQEGEAWASTGHPIQS